MKRIPLLIVIVILVWMPYEGRAGEYHSPNAISATYPNGTLACSDCHSIHGTQGGSSMLFDDSSPNLKLLRANSVLALCKFCHETDSLGMGAPDVWYNSQGYIPSAGDFADRGVADDTNRHDMGKQNMTTTPPPGNPDITWGAVVARYGEGSNEIFNCLYCHNQHGSENYRNLRYDPGNPANDKSASSLAVKVTYYNASADPVNCRDGTSTPCDVINDGLAFSGTTRFERGNVTFVRKASGTDAIPPINGIAPWCGKCHVDFHGEGGDSNMGGGDTVGGISPGDTSAWGDEWVRHPVRDINIGTASTNLHADSGNWGTAFTTRTRHIDPDGTSGNLDDEPFCLSCHYAHGGGNPGAGASAYNHTNLVKLDGGGNLNLQGTGQPEDYLLINICQQCHNQ